MQKKLQMHFVRVKVSKKTFLLPCYRKLAETNRGLGEEGTHPPMLKKE